MATSTKIKGLSKHMNQVFAGWEGIDMTLRKQTITVDPNGKPTGVSNTDSTIKGVISAVSFEEDDKFAGKLEDRQVRGIFLWASSAADMPEIHNIIIDDTDGADASYVITKILTVDWDIDNPVLITTELREVPYEA